jgi:2-polyprenyl-3-methyl-5-hydroxy-6-metoxy-1,4-benzoquinol methylase
MSSKFDLQDDLYTFPYHYLPVVAKGGSVHLHQQLSWGLEYLTYMTFAVELIRERRPESLLDVGCGDGRLLNMLQGLPIKMLGVDLSPRAISLAQAMNPNLDFLCRDVADLEEQYEMVTILEVLEHIPDETMSTFIADTAQRLKASGMLLVSAPSVNVPLNKKHYRHYDLSLLERTLFPYFEISRHWWLYRRGNLFEWLNRRLLCNSLFCLNQRHLTALIWRWHQRVNYFGSDYNGAHLIALANLR